MSLSQLLKKLKNWPKKSIKKSTKIEKNLKFEKNEWNGSCKNSST